MAGHHRRDVLVRLGTIVAVAPGTLEAALGIEYDFDEIWGLHQMRVEAFTHGTLAVLAATAVTGYLLARRAAKRTVRLQD